MLRRAHAAAVATATASASSGLRTRRGATATSATRPAIAALTTRPLAQKTIDALWLSFLRSTGATAD